MLLLLRTLCDSHPDHDDLPHPSMYPMSDWIVLESDHSDVWVPGVWSLRSNQDAHDDSTADELLPTNSVSLLSYR